MEIANSRRILVLSPAGVSPSHIVSTLARPAASVESKGKSRIEGDISAPTDSKLKSNPNPSSDGQPIHHISNSYYRASIPIWTDEVSSAEAWASQWKGEEGAAEVIRAVGAWVVCFHKPTRDEDQSALRTLLKSISSVLTHHATPSASSYSYENETDAVLLAVAVPTSTIHSSSTPPASIAPDSTSELDLVLDDLCREAGNWEYVDGTLPFKPQPHHPYISLDGPSSNPSQLLDDDDQDYGETTGLARLLEALEGGEWDAGSDGDGLEELEDYDVPGDEDEDDDGEAFMGDIASGFGELLAAGRDSRGAGHGTDELRDGLLARNDTTQDVAGADEAGPASSRGKGKGQAANQDEEDETWRVRSLPGGPGTAPVANTDDDVEALQAMMLKLQAARELGADLPMAERRKLAAKAVREVMRQG